MMWTAIVSWATGPAWAFLRRVPYWVWAVILLLITGRVMLSMDRKAQQEKGAAKEKEKFDKAIEEANEQTASRIEQAREAGKDIDEKLHGPDGDGVYTTGDLNERELRKLTENDPHNAGRVVRGA